MTTIDDEAILKSLGAIDIKPVDYDQWQRKERKKRVQKLLNTTSNTTSNAARNSSFLIQRPSSSVCNHGHKKTEPTGAHNEEKKAQRLNEVKVFELLIKSRKQSVDNYKSRQCVLLEENEKLQAEIQGAERATHKEVKQLLQKYERFRGAVSTLASKFDKEKAKAVLELEKTQEEVHAGLKGLEKQLVQVQDLLKLRRQELSVLLSYKDKEYPVKAMKIGALKKQIEQLSQEYEVEQEDMKNIISIEKEKYKVQGQETVEEIKSEATESAIASMHDSLKDMALQNMVMKKEIEAHHTMLKMLEDENHKLKEDVDALKISPEVNVRKQLFPHLYRTLPKCTPDMEVVLDIPMQEWLPI